MHDFLTFGAKLYVDYIIYYKYIYIHIYTHGSNHVMSGHITYNTMYIWYHALPCRTTLCIDACIYIYVHIYLFIYKQYWRIKSEGVAWHQFRKTDVPLAPRQNERQIQSDLFIPGYVGGHVYNRSKDHHHPRKVTITELPGCVIFHIFRHAFGV